MSPTTYLNSISYMTPVLVCSAGSPRLRACFPPAFSASSLSTGWKQNPSFQTYSMDQFQDPSMLPAQCWGPGTLTPQRGHRRMGKNCQFSGMLTCLVSILKKSSRSTASWLLVKTSFGHSGLPAGAEQTLLGDGTFRLDFHCLFPTQSLLLRAPQDLKWSFAFSSVFSVTSCPQYLRNWSSRTWPQGWCDHHYSQLSLTAWFHAHLDLQLWKLFRQHRETTHFYC